MNAVLAHELTMDINGVTYIGIASYPAELAAAVMAKLNAADIPAASMKFPDNSSIIFVPVDMEMDDRVNWICNP